MNFQEAVNYLLSNKSATYAFVPLVRHGKEVGGTIYVLSYDESFEEDPDEYWEYNATYLHGLYRSSSVEHDIIAPDDIPEEARTLNYHPSPKNAHQFLEYEVQIAKALLEGRSLDEVMAEA